jgi:hypothetical protein
MADEETTEVTQVSKGAFDLPAFAVAAQRASILQGGTAAAPAMRADQFDPARGQPCPEALRVVSAVTWATSRIEIDPLPKVLNPPYLNAIRD